MKRLLPLPFLLLACADDSSPAENSDRVVNACNPATLQCGACETCFTACLCASNDPGTCALQCPGEIPPEGHQQGAPVPPGAPAPNGPEPLPPEEHPGEPDEVPGEPNTPDTEPRPDPKPDPEDPETPEPPPEEPEAPEEPEEPEEPDPPAPPEEPEPQGEDDCYWEPVFPDANIDDLVRSYGGGGYWGDMVEIVARRWPAGSWFIAEIEDIDPLNQLVQFTDRNSWSGMVGWMDTLIHEGQHLFNAYRAIDLGLDQVLWIRADLIFELRRDLNGFARQEIRQDMEPGTCDLYCDTYFSGEQGSRGFNALLDEASCYANEVPIAGFFGEHYPGFGASVKDGAVAFLYYIALYLKRARTNYPDYYAQLMANADYQELVGTLWLRTHFFLQWADNYPNLGIDDQFYRDAMHQQQHLDEISRFVGRRVGDSHCFLD